MILEISSGCDSSTASSISIMTSAAMAATLYFLRKVNISFIEDTPFAYS